MSIPALLIRWLSAHSAVSPRTVSIDGTQHDATARPPLHWRAPWRALQFLSWGATTLSAPPFWMIGILLLIDSRSDQPSLMASVAVGNAVAIISTNQRHHRRRFTGRGPLALYYAGISMFTGDVLFLVAGWGTGALQSFVWPVNTTYAFMTVLWSATIAASFGVLSFVHADMLHAWLAFKTQRL